MLEVRQGCRSCTVTFKEFRFADCDEFFIEDLWPETANCPIEVNGATFTLTPYGLVMDPGLNTCALKPHRGLRIMWSNPILFRRDSNDQVTFELLCIPKRVAA